MVLSMIQTPGLAYHMIGDIGMMSTIIHLDMIWVLCLSLEGETLRKVILVNFVGKKSLPQKQTMMLVTIMTRKLGIVMDTTVIKDTKGLHDMMVVMTTLPVDLEATIITEMIAEEKIMIMLAGVMILIMKGAVLEMSIGGAGIRRIESGVHVIESGVHVIEKGTIDLSAVKEM